MNTLKTIFIFLSLTSVCFALENFDKENISKKSKLCTVSNDSKICEFDTTKAKINSYAEMLTFKTGLLKPDTRYILKMKVHATEGDPKAFLHFFIRNMVDVPYIDGTDIIKYNVPQSPLPQDILLKFKTPENAEKFAPCITTYKNLKCKIYDFSILEDNSLKFIPSTNDDTKYEIDPKRIPTGAKEFSVDKPNNPTGKVVEAKQFGIVPEKNVSISDINKALKYCKKIGASKLVFEKNARYNIFDENTIELFKMKDFIFDGNGATFIFRKNSKRANFYIIQNQRIEIRNLKIDWDWQTAPLASLAEIVDVNKEKEYIDFKFPHYDKHPNYPNYLRFAMCSPWDIKEKSVGLEDETNFNYDMHKGKRPRPKFEWLTPNTIRVYGKQAYQKTARKGMFMRVQHYYYDMTNMTMQSNSHITLSNITLFSCAGHGFTINRKQKYTHFDNVKIVLPENDHKRIITTTADHLHVVSSQGYIKLENCDFSYGADDCINFHDVSSFGTRMTENSLQNNRHSYGKIGDTIEFRNEDYSPLNFTAKIVDKKNLPNNCFQIIFDKKIPDSKNGKYIIFNKAENTHNIIVRNSYFHHNRARGVLILAHDVTIENCKFKRNEMGAIKLETGYTLKSWCEGYCVNNVLIRNNTFEECNPRGNKNWGFEREIFIGAYLKSDPSSEQTKYPVITNVMFADNTFINNYGMLATIGSAKNIIFANNMFVNTKSRKYPREYRNGFFATHAQDILIVDNKFRNKGNLTNNIGVWYESDSASNIVVKNNKASAEK